MNIFNDTFEGQVNSTRSGLPCLNWADTDLSSDNTLQANYCRDPYHMNEGGVWCFCKDCPAGREECDVPWCSGPVSGKIQFYKLYNILAFSSA